MSSRRLEIETWIRKDHFRFYKDFEEPFFGMTVNVPCTSTFQQAKEERESFFLLYLHRILMVVNEVEPFRYRIENNGVVIHDRIDGSATIDRPDGTFGFSYIPFAEAFLEFKKSAEEEIDRVRSTAGLHPSAPGDHVIHFSSLPWVKFTSFSHARRFSYADSCPKVSVGKVYETQGNMFMPVSVHVHHALVDGADVGGFFQKLETYLK